MDIWLAVVIGLTQLILGGMGVYVSLRPPATKHHWYWFGGFVAVGLLGIGLTGWLAKLGSDDQRRSAAIQERMGNDISATKQELQQSRVEQARMGGHIEGIQTILDTFAKSGFPGMNQLANAIRGLNGIGQQRPAEIGPSTVELCDKTRDLATQIRNSESTFQNNQSQIRDSEWQQRIEAQQQGKSREEQNAIFTKNNQADMIREQKHDQEFQRYLAQAKYYRDILIERLPPDKKDFFLAKNSSADQGLQSQTPWSSFWLAPQLATYLDELASGICPRAEPKRPTAKH